MSANSLTDIGKQATCPYSRQTVEVVREAPEKPAWRNLGLARHLTATNFPQPDFWTVFEAADSPIGCRSGLLAAYRFRGSDLPRRILKSGYERSCWLSQAWHTFISGIIRYSSAPLFHSQWQHSVNSAHNHHFADRLSVGAWTATMRTSSRRRTPRVVHRLYPARLFRTGGLLDEFRPDS